jgi:hypothetical protein
MRTAVTAIFCIAAIATSALISPLHASTVFYSDLSAWEANVDGNIATETYETYDWYNGGSNYVYLGSNTTLGEFDYSADEIFGYAHSVVYQTGQYLGFESNSIDTPASLTITLPTSTKAIAFDYGELRGGLQDLTIFLDNGDTATVTSALNDYAFFGAISDTTFTSLTLVANNYPIIDNLSTVNPVPIPTSLLLLSSGLGFFSVLIYRRKAT